MKKALLALFALPVLSACTGGAGSPTPMLHLGLTHSLVQKGPFSQGSDVTVQELDASYEPTGKSYSTKTVDDFGAFSFNSDIGSPFVEIITTGYYFDEVAGALSPSQLSLRVITDFSASSVNINILTTLAEDRIKYLIVSGGKSYDEAKAQAEKEILKVFKIPDEIAAGLSGFELMDISQPGDGNAILLAVSAVLQGNNTVAELSEEISKIASDMKSDGTLDSAALVSSLHQSAVGLDLGAIRSNLQNRYSQLGLANTIPGFEKYVDSDGDGIINAYDYVLTAPSGAITASSPTFQWTASELPGAGYHFQISTESDFSSILEEASALTTTQYTLETKLSNLGTYYWRLLITGTHVPETNWGGTSTITFDLGAVTLSAPSGTITETRPTYTWTASAVNGARYNIEVATDAAFTHKINHAELLTTTSYASGVTLADSSTHYFRVAVVDEGGVVGAWAGPQSFTVDLGAVALSSPPDGSYSNVRAQAFAWTANDAAATYELVVATNSGLASPVLTKSGLSGTQYTLSRGEQLPATASTTYYWAVTPVDAHGIAGTPSSISRFVLDTAAPSGAVIINNDEASATSANVSLALSASDASPVSQMRFAESAGALTTAPYVSYAATSSLTLSAGDGAKTVFAQFKDAAGNESTPAQDSITVEAGVVYVSTSGNDSHSGTRDLPKATIQAAVDLAQTLSAASRVKVAAGVYPITSSISVNGGVMLLGGFSPDDWSVRNPEANITRITRTDHAGGFISDVDIHDTTGSSGIDGFTVEVISTAGGGFTWPVWLKGSATVSNNVLYSRKSDGFTYAIEIYGGSPKIYNNLMYLDGNLNYGVECRDDSTPLIMNNDLIAVPSGASAVFTTDTSHPQVLNNIVQNFATVVYEVTWGSGPSVVENNDAWGFTNFYHDSETTTDYSIASLGAGLPGTVASGNLSVDLTADLADADGADNNLSTTDDNNWRLLGTTPASISQGGLDLSAWFTTDRAGVTRTAPWTIGAYK